MLKSKSFMESNIMQGVQNTYLKFILFNQLTNWSSYSLLGKNLIYTQKFPFVRIGDFLKRDKTQITIQDGVLYKRATIRINGKGISLRDEVDGKSIGTKKQFKIRKGQFLLSKIDARNGAFGVVPEELDGGIITGNFWAFDVDYSKINPYYLTLLTGTKKFQKLSQTASVGTTNRNYLQEESFLNFEIPLPILTEQERIVSAYNQKIHHAELLAQEADNLEYEIEKFFLNQIGLKTFSLKEKVSGLQTTNYSVLERWDFFSTDSRIAIELRKSKYELMSIGNAFIFVKRSFNKAQYNQDTFKYIEIGAIDPIKGILKAQEVQTNKAPSRATQIVKEGDLIIGTTRPYLKKFTIVSKEYDGCVCSSGFSVIAESSKYHLPYLNQFLKCTYGVEQLKNKMTGSLYPAITEEKLKEIKIPLPAVWFQRKIMELIEQNKKNILKNKESLLQLNEQARKVFEKEIFG